MAKGKAPEKTGVGKKKEGQAAGVRKRQLPKGAAKWILVAASAAVVVCVLVLFIPPLFQPSSNDSDQGPSTGPQQGSTVVLTSIREITQNQEGYVGEEITVNGTLYRQMSGSLYFWYVVDSKGFSLALDYTNEIGALYDEHGELLIMLEGEVYLSETDRATLSITEIVTPDYGTTTYVMFCSDGTIYGGCAAQKPLYCNDGVIVDNASVCGCPTGEVVHDDGCIPDYEVGPTGRNFNYTLRASRGEVSMTVYSGLNNYLAGLSRPDSYLQFLDEAVQLPYMEDLVEGIKAKSNNREDQARIAISLVQNIPCDSACVMSGELDSRYPYEVLYDGMAFCDEKARLLAFLLRELGLGAVLFNYTSEEHMAVGIECSVLYDYDSTGYCFIEPVTPSIVTGDRGNYVGVERLTSTPDVLKISDGFSFNSVSEEYVDAQEWNRLGTLSGYDAEQLSQGDYSSWFNLVNKYGLETED